MDPREVGPCLDRSGFRRDRLLSDLANHVSSQAD
jgi:hypothetical protein